MASYVDTSAFLKLVVEEDRSAAMVRWARAHANEMFSSDLLRTEALRVARRHSAAALAEARHRLTTLDVLTITTATCERAAELDPAILRALDAIHLASAMSIGDELERVVTYDERLVEAARLHGIPTVSP